jgi:hypothetical protein
VVWSRTKAAALIVCAGRVGWGDGVVFVRVCGGDVMAGAKGFGGSVDSLMEWKGGEYVSVGSLKYRS